MTRARRSITSSTSCRSWATTITAATLPWERMGCDATLHRRPRPVEVVPAPGRPLKAAATAAARLNVSASGPLASAALPEPSRSR